MTMQDITERAKRVESEYKKWEERYEISFIQEFNVKALLALRDQFECTEDRHTKTKSELLNQIYNLEKNLSLRPKADLFNDREKEYIDYVNNVTQDKPKIGQYFLKTTKQRLDNKDEVRDELKSIGIDIADKEGNLKTASELIEELGHIWSDLDKSKQQDITLLLAGRFHAARFIVLMGMFDKPKLKRILLVFKNKYLINDTLEVLKSLHEGEITQSNNGRKYMKTEGTEFCLTTKSELNRISTHGFDNIIVVDNIFTEGRSNEAQRYIDNQLN